MRKSLILCLFLFSHLSHAETITTSAIAPWLTGYSLKLEGEIETDRNKKGEIKGYESEIDLQIRKKLSKSLSLFVGSEVEGEQEKSEAAYYRLQESSIGLRKKYKWGLWKIKNQGAFRYYVDHEERKKRGIDGALFLRTRFRRYLTRNIQMRLRARYFEFIKTRGEEGTRERRIRLEARPSYKLFNFEFGTIHRLTYTKEIGNDRSVFDFGPIIRWNFAPGFQLTLISEYRPWDTREAGHTVPLFETEPIYSLELEMRI